MSVCVQERTYVFLCWKHKLLTGCMCAHSYITGFGGRVVHDHICTSTKSHWLGYEKEIEVRIYHMWELGKKLMPWFGQR